MSLHFEFEESLETAQQELVREAVSKAVDHIARLLPLTHVRFNIQLNEKLAIPEFGVGGWCFNATEIGIALSPGRESDWLLHLPRTVAHEWHHLARWRGPGYGDTLVDTMISEGLAQHFEVESFAGAPPFYSTALTQEWRTKMMDVFVAEATQSGYDHSRWFFGTADFPFLAGYDFSFFLLDQYLRIKNSVASKCVSLSSNELLEFIRSVPFRSLKSPFDL